MGIPESQLETWSHQGSISQSSDTYNSIRSALTNANASYAGKDFNVFLQGSYGNDTNIYSESDVDIVIQLNDIFYIDLSSLSEEQKRIYGSSFSKATYQLVDFKRDVIQHLNNRYGNDVVSGEKAVSIKQNGNRRKVDIVIAAQYRRYYKFNEYSNQTYDEGMTFWDSNGTQIINYPKQHSKNMTLKHQATNNWLKPMVRILKNARGKLIQSNDISKDIAPSYYLEGLLYNVPADKFTTSYHQSLFNILKWLETASTSEFVCANEQYYLLREEWPVTWRDSKYQSFFSSMVKLWNEW